MPGWAASAKPASQQIADGGQPDLQSQSSNSKTTDQSMVQSHAYSGVLSDQAEDLASRGATSESSPSGAQAQGPINASVTITEFADFQCPFCAGVVSILQEVLKEYPGQVRVVFRNFPLDFHQDAPLAHRAALAANEQGKFWEMHDRIFSNQRAMKRDDLIRGARALGLDVPRFIADMDSARFEPIVNADRQEGIRLGVNGTPTFVVNGTMLVGARPLDEFRRLIDVALVTPGEAGPVSRHTVAPDPLGLARLAVNLAMGPTDAPITILWFSDLQSPLTLDSARLVQHTIETFPGKVRIQFKNFPLGFHVDAPLAHEAAAAAADQGKFWEMEDLLIKNQSALKQQDLIRYASLLGLDMPKFESALSGRTYRALVARDLAEGQQKNVRGVPVFFINGKRIDGLKPFDQFAQAVEEELKQIHAAN